MCGFGFRVASEATGEASIGAAIGVNHKNYPLGLVQAHGFTNLVQDKLTICFEFRRGQALGAAGNLDGIGIIYPDALEKLAKSQIKPVIEAPEDSRVALIPLARTFEMKYLFHDATPAFDLRCFSQASCSDFPQCAISIW